MPLPKYTIRPSHISLVTMPPIIDNELEFVSNETFCNLMHRMASVVNVASEIFSELSSDLTSLMSRLCNVEQRVGSISAAGKGLPTSEEFLTVGLQNPLVPYASQRQEASEVLHGNTKPACMRTYYEQAQPPPPLDVMDDLRDDNKTTSRLYSDSKFFFELWRQEMLDDYKGKKTPKKKASLFRLQLIVKFISNICNLSRVLCVKIHFSNYPFSLLTLRVILIVLWLQTKKYFFFILSVFLYLLTFLQFHLGSTTLGSLAVMLVS